MTRRKRIVQPLITGLVGFSVVLLLNLFTYLVLQRPSAAIFSDHWNTLWLPAYSVWFVILVIGLFRKTKTHA